ncbi:MAG: aminoglycoside 6-adenylyltransferase [Chitinophagaceae bacterium]
MIQQNFAARVVTVVEKDPQVIGLAVGGSWADEEMDEFSDIDLVLVTREKTGGDKEKMLAYAKSFGDFISGFTGDHVGEPRLLICLYDDPLLHVDIKFVTLKEFESRVENPVILFERDKKLTEVIQRTRPDWPEPDLQWIEDRIWTWVHYVAAKIGRGEYFDALNGIEFIRANVLSPLMQVKNRKKARSVRKVEQQLNAADLENLKITVAEYNKASLLKSLDNIISIYRSLRRKLGTEKLQLQEKAEKKSTDYFKQIRKS